MPAYVIVEIEINDAERYEQYKAMAPAAVAAYGGIYLARGGMVETLEGDWDPQRVVILQFPSFEDAQRWWHSEEYREAKALRHATTNSRMIVIQGLEASAHPVQ